MSAVRDAATVILVREPEQGSRFEVLMVKRSAKSTFMPDVYVYPGGALDEADCAPDVEALVSGLDAQGALDRLAEPHLSPSQALGLYMAAVREVFEESGVLLAMREGESTRIDLVSDRAISTRFGAHRIALRRGELAMSQMLREEGLVLELGDVGYFARWITPLQEKRRYDARFFVVRAPTRQLAMHDDFEVVDHIWLTPEHMLERYHAGELLLAPPTFSTLERMVALDSIEALMTHADSWSPVPLLPDVRGKLGAPETRLLLPHHPDYDESLCREHLLPFWDRERCKDAPEWRVIARDERGWVTKA